MRLRKQSDQLYCLVHILNALTNGIVSWKPGQFVADLWLPLIWRQVKLLTHPNCGIFCKNRRQLHYELLFHRQIIIAFCSSWQSTFTVFALWIMIIRSVQHSRRRIHMRRVPGQGIRTLATSTLKAWNKTRISLSMVTTLFKVVDFVCVTSFRACYKLHVLPYNVRANGMLVVNTGLKEIVLHWAVLIAYAAVTTHKLMAFMRQTSDSETMNVKTMVSLTLAMAYTGTLCFSASTLFKKQETCELVNTCQQLSREFIPSAYAAQVKMPNILAAVQIVGLVPVLSLVAIAMPAATVVLQGIPGTFLMAAEDLGLIPQIAFVPHVVWRMLFWPLEMTGFCPLLLLTGCTAMIVTRGVQVGCTCASELRYSNLLVSMNSVLLKLRITNAFVSLLQQNKGAEWRRSPGFVEKVTLSSDLLQPPERMVKTLSGANSTDHTDCNRLLLLHGTPARGDSRMGSCHHGLCRPHDGWDVPLALLWGPIWNPSDGWCSSNIDVNVNKGKIFPTVDARAAALPCQTWESSKGGEDWFWAIHGIFRRSTAHSLGWGPWSTPFFTFPVIYEFESQFFGHLQR